MLELLVYYTTVREIITSETLYPVPEERGCLFSLPVLSPDLIFLVLESLQHANSHIESLCFSLFGDTEIVTVLCFI